MAFARLPPDPRAVRAVRAKTNQSDIDQTDHVEEVQTDVALFGKNKDNNGTSENAEAEPEQTGAFSPEKARKFFGPAKTNHETGNYAYAVQLWLNGLSHDPSSIEGVDGFILSVRTFLADGGKKSEARNIAKGLQGKGQVLKYQQALLEWGFKPEDPALTVRAAEAAASLGLEDVCSKMGIMALERTGTEKKPRKDLLIKLLDAGEKAGAFKLAVEAGDRARKLDPSDGNLDRRVKEMMAQSAISGGGFTDSGAGGFRKNIRDADKQTMLEASERISKTDDVKDRIVEEAEAAYAEKPDDVPTIEKLGRALAERDRIDDLKRAYTIYTKAHKQTDQFRFRQRAGEIKTRLMKRQIRLAKEKLEKSPDDAELAKKIETAENQLREHETAELELQIKNYPTDLTLRFEMGKAYAQAGRHEEAIQQFQRAEEDSKNRRLVLKHKAESFLALGGWEEAAVDTFRQALQGIADESGDLALELKYGLMCALQNKATAGSDPDAAEEAEKLASQISLKKFGYKDVAERRNQLKSFLAEMKG